MRIRLTVLGPRGGRACDVLVTAPAGTTLGAVAGALAGTVGTGQPARSAGSAVPLYAGTARLDPDAPLGVPPLVDGAVLALQTPAEEHGHHQGPLGPPGQAGLHVVGGPDAGGVHLLQGGQVRIGRSADADVPLDDPDVSRLHCAVTIAPDGLVHVADLGSTNGTRLDGRPVGADPVPLVPGALLRIGESTLRLEGPAATGTIPPAPRVLPIAPDGEGHLCVSPAHGGGPATDGARPAADRVPAPRAPHAAAPRPAAQAPAGGAAPGDGAADPWAAAGSDAAGWDRPASAGRPRSEDVTLAGRPGPRDESSPPAGWPGAIGAWARRIAGATARPADRDAAGPDQARLAAEAAALRELAPDPATVLVTALGPGPRLWERGPGHLDALTVRLGSADLPTGDGPLPAVPVTVDLRESGSLALTGPRPRLSGLARAVIAQLCALHSPSALEIVLLSADRSRPPEQRAEEWAWLNWLPHLRPSHGQDCRLLVAFDHDQARARVAELLRRVDSGPADTATAQGSYSVVVVDGDPGSATLREALHRLAHEGPAAGIHLLCLAEPGAPAAAECGVRAALDGDVATALSLEPAGPPLVTVDAVSAAWAERLARALAPLREADGTARRPRSALPETARLLDELDLALATPSKVTARWAAETTALTAVLGTGQDGPVGVDLVLEGPHLLVGGSAGAGKTELLRSAAAALAATAAPDRLALLLVDGAPDRGEGLRICTDLPHVHDHLAASDPLRMREFAQAVAAELKRREELLADTTFDAWHAERRLAGRLAAPHAGSRATTGSAPGAGRVPSAQGAVKTQARPGVPLPRLVLVVDDLDALTAPALGAPGRPSAGSVVRAVEAVARGGARLGVHLICSTGRPERTAGTDADGLARLRIALRTEDPESAALLVGVEDPAALDEHTPGRGYLRRPDGAVAPFQTARVSGRIPRTATLRPTVVPLEWDRMGDPPTRRPLRELGNGPTDLALLASALQRAADQPLRG